MGHSFPSQPFYLVTPSAVNYDDEPQAIKVCYSVLSKLQVFLVKVSIKGPRKSYWALGVLIFWADLWRHANDDLNTRKALCGAKRGQGSKDVF